jgi:hypothetical protein
MIERVTRITVFAIMMAVVLIFLRLFSLAVGSNLAGGLCGEWLYGGWCSAEIVVVLAIIAGIITYVPYQAWLLATGRSR